MNTADHLRPVVCGIDDSPAASLAARWASALVDAPGDDLILLHAFRPPPVVPAVMHAGHGALPVPGSVLRAEARAADRVPLENVAAQLAGAPVCTLLREGDPALQLLDTAAAAQAGLIVVGNRGRGGWRATVLGSVSRAVVRAAERPVLVVGEDHAPPRSGAAGVVAGVDPEHEPADVVRDAAAVAAALRGELVLCHVTDGPADGAPPAWLAGLAEIAGALGVTPRAVVRCGEPATELLALAGERASTVVAVGSHRRGALASKLLGSVSTAVIDAGTAPVLVAAPA